MFSTPDIFHYDMRLVGVADPNLSRVIDLPRNRRDRRKPRVLAPSLDPFQRDRVNRHWISAGQDRREMRRKIRF